MKHWWISPIILVVGFSLYYVWNLPRPTKTVSAVERTQSRSPSDKAQKILRSMKDAKGWELLISKDGSDYIKHTDSNIAIFASGRVYICTNSYFPKITLSGHDEALISDEYWILRNKVEQAAVDKLSATSDTK